MVAAERLINAVRAAAIATGLITAEQVFNNKYYRQYYQSFHSTVYGAVRQRFRPYTKIFSQTFWGEYSSYIYFWSIKPY